MPRGRPRGAKAKRGRGQFIDPEVVSAAGWRILRMRILREIEGKEAGGALSILRNMARGRHVGDLTEQHDD